MRCCLAECGPGTLGRTWHWHSPLTCLFVWRCVTVRQASVPAGWPDTRGKVGLPFHRGVGEEERACGCVHGLSAMSQRKTRPKGSPHARGACACAVGRADEVFSLLLGQIYKGEYSPPKKRSWSTWPTRSLGLRPCALQPSAAYLTCCELPHVAVSGSCNCNCSAEHMTSAQQGKVVTAYLCLLMFVMVRVHPCPAPRAMGSPRAVCLTVCACARTRSAPSSPVRLAWHSRSMTPSRIETRRCGSSSALACLAWWCRQ